MRERMLIQRVIYCPASTCFTVSAHSLTHACMLCFTETPRSSYNKVNLTCICAHKDTSVTPGKKSLLWKTKKVQIVHQLPLSVYCLCDNDVVMFARNCHVSHQKKNKKKNRSAKQLVRVSSVLNEHQRQHKRPENKANLFLSDRFRFRKMKKSQRGAESNVYTNICCIFPHGAVVAKFPVKLATVKKPNPPTRSVPHRPMNPF